MKVIEEAESHAKRLALPWTYFAEEDQIYSQEDDIEYGDYGSIISTGKEIIAEFLGQERSEEIVKAVNSLPNIITDTRKWQDIAIEERANYNILTLVCKYENCDGRCTENGELCGYEQCPRKEEKRADAAKELGADAGQWVRMTEERRKAIQWAIELIGEMLEECK